MILSLHVPTLDGGAVANTYRLESFISIGGQNNDY